MRLKHVGVALLLGTLLAVSAAPSSAAAETPETFPLSKVKRGQKGYGLTTIAGRKPFRFEFEVLGISRNFIPKIDIILVKSDDPKMQHTGFWQGMSGSPLFIDGKLACAFSYGWRFSRSPVGGCTPIHYMRKDGATPRRHLESAWRRDAKSGHSAKARAAARHRKRGATTMRRGRASWNEWLALAPDGTARSALYTMSAPRKPWLLRAPRPASATSRALRAQRSQSQGMPSVLERPEGPELVAASVPLALSGFSAPAFAEAKSIMQGFPVQPMRGAGGTGQPTDGPTEFELGAPMGVQLIRGDMSGTGTCTVSWVESDTVLACGHPMFGSGEMYAPVTSSEVHLVMASQMSSFLVASPLREIGTLVQDRQSMIMADTGLKTRMVPIDIEIESPGRGGKNPSARHEFHVEVINNRFFTGPFAGVAAMNAITRYMPDRDRATVHMQSTVYIKGKKPLHFTDHLYASNGAGSLIGGARGLRVLVPLLSNPFEPVTIERVELRARISYATNFGQVVGLRLPSAELKPGKRGYVDVQMTTYNGSRIVERVPFDVPASLAGSIVRLRVTAGDSAGVDAAPAQNLDELLDSFRRLLPGDVFAVVLFSADQGAAIDGKLIRDLPPSAADRLKLASRTDRTAGYRPASRSTFPSRRVIDGSASLLVKVADR